jgi:hypothetical protein
MPTLISCEGFPPCARCLQPDSKKLHRRPSWKKSASQGPLQSKAGDLRGDIQKPSAHVSLAQGFGEHTMPGIDAACHLPAPEHFHELV